MNVIWCCEEMRDEYINETIVIDKDEILMLNIPISYCPFCGAKVENRLK